VQDASVSVSAWRARRRAESAAGETQGGGSGKKRSSDYGGYSDASGSLILQAMKRVVKPSEGTPRNTKCVGDVPPIVLTTGHKRPSTTPPRDAERVPPVVNDTSWLIKSAYMDLLARPALSVKQTAQIFGVGEKAVRTMCKDGVLEELRAGRLVRISTQSVRKLLGLHA
jgi:excisionase family DNA binding protein